MKKKTLANGLRVLLAPIKGTKTVTVLVLVGTGSKYEKKHLNGISHFLEHLFFKGTKKRPNTKIITSELDGVGGEYNAFTGKEETGYWVKVDASHLELALDIVSDMLLNATFDAKEIEREKGVIVEEINMYQDNPMQFVPELFEELLYGDQPAGWNIAGDAPRIRKMTRKDIVGYNREQYVAKNTVVCVAGNIPAKTGMLVEKYFTPLQEGSHHDKPAVTESQKGAKAAVRFKKTDQAHIMLGVRAYARKHQDRHVLRVLATILGGNMSSRLFISVRERQGLAYYIRAMAESYTDSGYLAVHAGITSAQLEKALATIIKEFQLIRDKKVDAKELKKAKEYIKGKTLINFEGSDDVATYYAEQAVLDGKTVALKDAFKKIDAVTAADIQRVARDIFVNDKLNLYIIGPYKSASQFKKLLHLK